MEQGDLSNEVSPRLMVTYDVVTEDAVREKRFLGVAYGITTRRTFDVVSLNRLWVYTRRLPLTLELVNFGVDDVAALSRLDELDRKYVNPFNISTGWQDVGELLAALPYRPDVIGVLDIEERRAHYGHRGIGMDYLERVL